MNKKKILILAAILLSGLLIVLGYLWYSNRATAEQKQITNTIDNYYDAKPNVVTQEELNEANSNLQKAEEGSFCDKAGYDFQITNSEGGIVCTQGYH